MIELLIVSILLMVNYAANELNRAAKQIDEFLREGGASRE